MSDMFAKLHLPGMPADAQVQKIVFLRRKPQGFTTGHALLTQPNYGTKTKVGLGAAWAGTFLFFASCVTYQQIKLKAWKNPFA